MSNLCVFTTVESEASASLLRHSCDRVGLQLHLYETGTWRGYADGKIRGALDFLRTRTEPICMFVDGHDSFILKGEDAILDALNIPDEPIIISCEKTCWPDATIGIDFLDPNKMAASPWCYPNSGGWIGDRGALVEALSKMLEYVERWPGDDQRCWQEYCLGWPQQVHRDTECSIFQCMGGTGEEEINGAGVNTITFRVSMVWHFNGRTPGREEWYRKLTGDKL